MKTPAPNSLVVPVELVAHEIPGDRPPAIRMRLAAKRLGRAHHVKVIGWLSTEQLAALKGARIGVDLDTLEPVTDSPGGQTR